MISDVECFAQPGLGSVLVDRFVHFSSEEGIASIVDSGELRLSETIPGAVFAAAVGGRSVPGVQHARGGFRDRAVLFAADVSPMQWFPEEVIWRRPEPLPISVLEVVSVSAADALLDGSLGIPDDGWWHDGPCRCVQCVHRLQVLDFAAAR